MSAGINFLLKSLQLLAAQNGEPTAPSNGESSEMPTFPRGGEHGAVYFNLDWQARQATDRQRIAESIYGDNPAPENDTGDDNSNFANFRQSNSDANSFRRSNAESNLFRESNAHQNAAQTARDNLSSYSNNNNTNNAYLNNRQNDEPVFNTFQHQPENLRSRILQMSEPRLVEVEIDGRIETRQLSHFDELVARMQTLELTPNEFARTLPSEEREAFLARFQFAPTSGEHLPATPVEKAAIENKQFQLPENQNHGEKLPAQITAPAKNVQISSANYAEENTFGTIPQTANGKTNEVPQNIIPADKALAAPYEANAKLTNGATNFTGAQSSNARALNNSNGENSTVGNNLTRRENGVNLGGALISGAFAAVGEHEQSENNRVGDACGNGNFYAAHRSGFAAGATGALLSAAIGRVIPGVGTDVSGVLGFISGVVVGVEIDAGLRWLGAAKTELPAVNNFQLNAAEDVTLNSQLLLGYA